MQDRKSSYVICLVESEFGGFHRGRMSMAIFKKGKKDSLIARKLARGTRGILIDQPGLALNNPNTEQTRSINCYGAFDAKISTPANHSRGTAACVPVVQ